jgi:chromosome segregation protein
VAIEHAGIDREAGELGERGVALELERASLVDRVAAIARELAAADEEGAIAADAVAATAAESDAARAALREAEQGDAAARAALARASDALTALDGRVSALESLERERVGLAPAAARLLAERARFGDGAVLGPLSDYIVADQDGAALVERFLGVTLHAVVVRDRAAADAIRAWHGTTAPGALLLLPLDAAAAAAPIDATPAAAASLLGHVSAAQTAGAWVRALLDGATDLGGGQAFADRRGAVWLPGTTAGPGPLRRRAELAELRAAHETAVAARANAAHAADAARALLAAAQARAATAVDAAAAAEQAGRRAAERREEHERRRQRAERELRDAGLLADRLAERASVLATRRAELAAEAARQQALLDGCERGASDARAALTQAGAAHDDARERRTAQQVALAQAEARVHVAADRTRRLAEAHATATGRLDALQQELATLATADAALAAQLAAWRTDHAARAAALDDAERRLAAAEAAVATADAALVADEETLAAARHRATALATESHHAEIRHTELSGRRMSVRSLFEGQWQRSLDELLAAADAGDAATDAPDAPGDGTSDAASDGTAGDAAARDEGAATPDALRREAAALQEELAALGPVNALAIEEHAEETTRLEFLTAQRADLTAGKASLQQAIREIDLTAREMFLATFTQVREHFRQIFMTLFGGGECDLRLENPDAPLDCDIEIHASPRGKRTQRIHLLSSGERALVALSLLFGIFLTKPSPFCLLDEVDAPLDDQNIGRFVRMLVEFKSRTQFIVITHNPRTTTEAADAVYGVTMQEPGVSSLVGVRLRPDHPAVADDAVLV